MNNQDMTDAIASSVRFKIALSPFLHRAEEKGITVPPVIDEWWQSYTNEVMEKTP